MLSQQQIKNILQQEYGIKCNALKQLVSYVDINFSLKDELTGSQYIMRMTEESNLHSTNVLNHIDGAKEHLHLNGFKVPHLIKTKSGKNRTFVKTDKTGEAALLYVQLSAFIPGQSILEADLSADALYGLAEDVGYFNGLINKCLLEYSSEPSDCFDKSFVWYTQNFHILAKYIDLVKDAEMKNIIEGTLQKFNDIFHTLMPELRTSTVHGDFSNSNIILINEKQSNETPVKEKFGLIDFEDCHSGLIVFDLSICMAYMMTNVKNPEKDALKLAGKILSGFQKVLPLTVAEEKVLFLGIMARWATSYVMSIYFTLKHPENATYLSVQSSKCPKLLKMFWQIGEDAIMKQLLPSD